jgi:hypothetical protein
MHQLQMVEHPSKSWFALNFPNRSFGFEFLYLAKLGTREASIFDKKRLLLPPLWRTNLHE